MNLLDKKFLNVKEAAQIYPFSQQALRYIIFNAKHNGAESFIRRIGKRKIIILRDKFEDWIENNGNIPIQNNNKNKFRIRKITKINKKNL